MSWYEAAAYAEFAGKELPTSAHWRLGNSLAAVVDWLNRPLMAFMAEVSNFNGDAPRPTSTSTALDAFGTYDMAGNVREWCWNQTGAGRVMRGGAWNDIPYMYGNVSQAPAFDRSPKNGFRCVRYLERSAIPEVAFAPLVSSALHDYTRETPVSDTIFGVYRDQFSYTRTDVVAKTEARDDRSPDWLREKVSFTAAYANDRVIAILFLPKKSVPPYQAVIYFPGSGSETFTDKSDTILLGPEVEFIVKSGRALVYPIYYGTYERNSPGASSSMVSPTSQYRDVYTEVLVKIGRDLRRTIDYLEGRSDIDASRLAYFGMSWGGKMGPVMTAIEDRLKASVLYLGGLSASSAARPESLEFNYAPHSRVPTLMLNGRYDLTFPLQSAVQPMFDHLGTPPGKKQLKLYDTDHFVPRQELIKETLAWLDQHLGPVNLKPVK